MLLRFELLIFEAIRVSIDYLYSRARDVNIVGGFGYWVYRSYRSVWAGRQYDVLGFPGQWIIAGAGCRAKFVFRCRILARSATVGEQRAIYHILFLEHALFGPGRVRQIHPPAGLSMIRCGANVLVKQSYDTKMRSGFLRGAGVESEG